MLVIQESSRNLVSGTAGKSAVAAEEVIKKKPKATNIFQRFTDNYYFWVAVALFALFEPLVCSQYPTPRLKIVQYLVLAISTFLYGIQLIGVSSREGEEIYRMQLESNYELIPIVNLSDMKIMKLLIFMFNEEEYLFEAVCLGLGWACIFPYPGIAALRCFRVFRLLWFYEVKVFRAATSHYFNPVFGKHFVNRVFRVLKFAIKAITALIDEMLRIGHRTKGGIILIMMLFYTAYVMGIVLWVETRGVSPFCDSVGTCIFTLMRLTFFDGNGFDFAFFLTKNHRGLFFITIFYLILTSFGILNGLVGIFGNVFANASEEAFGVEEAEEEKYEYEDEGGEYNFSNGRESPSSRARAALKSDSLEAGDIDQFDGHELPNLRAENAFRKNSMDSDRDSGVDSVIPFTNEMSLNYFPSTKKVNPYATLSEPTVKLDKYDADHVQDQPFANGKAFSSKPTTSHPQANYSALLQLLDMRKQGKPQTASPQFLAPSQHPSPTARLNQQSELPLAAPKLGALGRQGTSGGKVNIFASSRGRSMRGGTLADEAATRSIQSDLHQLRHDMCSMMKMQAVLQQQLATLTGTDAQVLSRPGSPSLAARKQNVGGWRESETMRPYTP